MKAPVFMVQALVVTCGPFKGRICENDDDDFVFKSEFTKAELKWFKSCGVKWRKLELDERDEQTDLDLTGVDCEIVTFGFYLTSRGNYRIPQQFLRPATMNDLVTRLEEISEVTVSHALLDNKDDLDDEDIMEILKEEIFITNNMWRRELMALNMTGTKNIFLCHSSADKYFVRRVNSDFVLLGHRTWMDEFEIKVGDSIIEKINDGITEAGYLILFLSKNSISSSWVSREWNSTLARQITAKNVKILPALIEDCEIPSIISDLKYADFRQSYKAGLDELIAAVN